MMKKTFGFTTQITPETEVLLSGESGRPLSMSFTNPRGTMSVTMDTGSVIRLQAFLEDYLREEGPGCSSAPSYQSTGRMLAVMDGRTLDLVRVFPTGTTAGLAHADADSYEALAEKVSACTDTELPADAVFILYDRYDGAISEGVIRRILRACTAYQVDYVRTGDPARSRRMVLGDIEAFTTIDASVISRATRSVRILSPAGTFSLDGPDASPDVPSLFDEGATRTDGKPCSRKAVLAVLKGLLAAEDPGAPLTDEQMASALREEGYAVARRTVTKYRDLLGVPKCSARKAR